MKPQHYAALLISLICLSPETHAGASKKPAPEAKTDTAKNIEAINKEKEIATNAATAYYTFFVSASALSTMKLQCRTAAAMENGTAATCANDAKKEAENLFQKMIAACNKSNNSAGADALIDYYAAWTKTMDFLGSRFSGRPGTNSYESRLDELTSEMQTKELKAKFKIPPPQENK